MNTASPRQLGVRKPRMLRWVAWTVLILIGGTFLVAVISAFVAVAVDGLDTRKLPVLLAIMFVAVSLTWLQCGFNPIRRRTDQMNRWRQQFPTQSEQSIQAFLQIVGESLDLRKMHTCKLSPDDRAGDLSRSFFDDKMVEMIIAVEEAYNVTLPDDSLNTCENLGQLFAYVTQHGTVRPVSPAIGRRDQPERG